MKKAWYRPLVDASFRLACQGATLLVVVIFLGMLSAIAYKSRHALMNTSLLIKPALHDQKGVIPWVPALPPFQEALGLQDQKRLISHVSLLDLLRIEEEGKKLKARLIKPAMFWVRMDGEALETGSFKEITPFLEKHHLLKKNFNQTFFTQSDSFDPQNAGILGGVVGTLYLMIILVTVAIPLGLGGSIFLTCLCKEGLLKRTFESFLTNLAAVPSVVYGLVGASLWLGFCGLPRSSALVGGLTLIPLTLPMIMMTTSAALRRVPLTLIEAAKGLGATPLQIVFHHALPHAFPSILTGILLSLSRALGETAPLLMIGMMAFVVDIPGSLGAPSSSLPVLIFSWSRNPQAAFLHNASLAIMGLLGLTFCLNLLAIGIRIRYEKRR